MVGGGGRGFLAEEGLVVLLAFFLHTLALIPVPLVDLGFLEADEVRELSDELLGPVDVAVEVSAEEVDLFAVLFELVCKLLGLALDLLEEGLGAQTLLAYRENFVNQLIHVRLAGGFAGRGSAGGAVRGGLQAQGEAETVAEEVARVERAAEAV